MKELWLQYNNIVFIVLSVILFVLIMCLNVLSIESCKMMKLKEQIDRNGEITDAGIYPVFNLFLSFYLFVSIPSAERYPQYYQFDVFERQVSTVKSLRKFLLIAFPIYFIVVITLLNI